MKKLLVVLVMVLVLVSPINVNAKTKTRTQGGVYVSSHIIKTKDGNLWKVAGRRYKKGTKVIITFNTRNTKRKTDDVIMKIKSARK